MILNRFLIKNKTVKSSQHYFPLKLLYYEDDEGRSYLAPPLPPVITGSRLRRVNSSTLSLNKTKKKLLTVEELYVEVLYTILHMIGCDIDQVRVVIILYFSSRIILSYFISFEKSF